MGMAAIVGGGGAVKVETSDIVLTLPLLWCSTTGGGIGQKSVGQTTVLREGQRVICCLLPLASEPIGRTGGNRQHWLER